MRVWAAIVGVLSLAAPVNAQVINGESTYEDNFAHLPPSPDRPAKADGRTTSAADPSRGSAQDLHRRDRD